MWPFKRRLDIATLPSVASAAHRWSVHQATHEGAPLIVRLNSSAEEWARHPAPGVKLGFAVPLNAPCKGGLPTSEENSELQEIEEVILEEVGSTAKAVYVLSITTGEMKEFVFYIAPGVDIAATHQTIRSRVRSHDVQCMAITDPAWEAYTQFAAE